LNWDDKDYFRLEFVQLLEQTDRRITHKPETIDKLQKIKPSLEGLRYVSGEEGGNKFDTVKVVQEFNRPKSGHLDLPR
jgi:hypothetical protein